MSYYDKLKEEIGAKLDALEAAHLPMIPRWVTHAICADHESALAGDSEHSDFWRHGGYMHTRRMVTECINKRGDGRSKSTGDPLQLPLPGFDRDHLQDYYVVERDGEEVAGQCGSRPGNPQFHRVAERKGRRSRRFSPPLRRCEHIREAKLAGPVPATGRDRPWLRLSMRSQ
jgi:hypothetical protein